MTVTAADVEQAAARLEGVAHRTPVVTSRLVDEQVGAQVFLKCENLQRMGAFKFRGAYNALAQLAPEQRGAGVVAFSSGNHAQAVALSGQLLGIPTTIVMPHDAPAAKVTATQGYGAEVIRYDRHAEDRSNIAGRLAEERGAVLIPPFDHPHIIAGQGTAARELLAEVPDLDAVFTPLGGGGLLAGTALAVKAARPDCRVYGVEPAAGDDGQQSLRSGSIVQIEVPTTIADGAQTSSLGEHTFEVIRRDVTDILTVPDEALVAVLRLLATYAKLVVEPTGALGLAGLQSVAADFAGQRVGVLISGGNLDLDRYAGFLSPGGR